MATPENRNGKLGYLAILAIILVVFIIPVVVIGWAISSASISANEYGCMALEGALNQIGTNDGVATTAASCIQAVRSTEFIYRFEGIGFALICGIGVLMLIGVVYWITHSSRSSARSGHS